MKKLKCYVFLMLFLKVVAYRKRKRQSILLIGTCLSGLGGLATSKSNGSVTAMQPSIDRAMSTVYAAQSAHNASACSSTVFVASA